MTPSQIGERAEAAVMAALTHAGKTVYVPLGSSGRCDLIYQDAEGLHRVQVKNGLLRKRIVRFATCSNTKNVPLDYRNDVDAFGVYCDELQTVFLVPVDQVPLRAGYLRIGPPRNNQQRGVRWAEPYRLPWAPAQLQLDTLVRTSTEEPPEVTMPPQGAATQ